jgi:glutamyl-tRNA synthetase
VLTNASLTNAHLDRYRAGVPAHDGRFAPSPTGELHVGNLRTALVAWLFARSANGRFVVRMEDLDLTTADRRHAGQQLRDLAAIGLDWDGEVVFQSERFASYFDAIDDLTRRGLTYPCYCTRKEIQAAAAAPHEPAVDSVYPGTCRELSRRARSAREATGRRPALRLRADGAVVSFVDRLCGVTTGTVDDVVLCRNDGVPAYNLAVVIDDCAQGVGEVVRGDDLLSSTPRQLHIARVLGLSPPTYAHVPLVVATDGSRLAKRHGAVTLHDLAAPPARVLQHLARSLGLAQADDAITATDLVARFDPDRLPRTPWVFSGRLD